MNISDKNLIINYVVSYELVDPHLYVEEKESHADRHVLK